MTDKHGYYGETDIRTSELLATITYLEGLLPRDADPIHRERVVEIRRRINDGLDPGFILRNSIARV